MTVVDDEWELYFVFSLSNLSPTFSYVLSSVAFLAEALSSGRYRNFGPAFWPEFAHWCCGGHKIKQHILRLYGIKHDSCHLTEHRWMHSKCIKCIEVNPSHRSKVWDRALLQYFKIVTDVYLFMADYSDDERNIFVPNVDTVTHRLC